MAPTLARMPFKTQQLALSQAGRRTEAHDYYCFISLPAASMDLSLLVVASLRGHDWHLVPHAMLAPYEMLA